MQIVDIYDASDLHDKRTVYSIELDDGRTVDVMRKHSPGRGCVSLSYVMEPHDDDIDCGAVLAFFRNLQVTS